MALTSLDLITLTASHTRQLRRLVGRPRTPVTLPTASKAVMLAALHAAEIELLQTIALVSPSEYEQRPVCGVWTLHDLIGHLADWDRYFLNWLAVLTRQPRQDLYWDDDGDRFNAWLCEQRRGETWEQAWTDFRQNRQLLQQRLAAVPEAQFLRERRKAPFPSIYHCAWSALEHYLDHGAGVRRELQLPLPEDLLAFHGPYAD